jgi:hypothetical protein
MCVTYVHDLTSQVVAELLTGGIFTGIIVGLSSGVEVNLEGVGLGGLPVLVGGSQSWVSIVSRYVASTHP